MTHQPPMYVLCVDNSDYPVALETRKVYQQLPDQRAEADGLVRVIDESGEDYLYPSSFFVPISVPDEARKVFAGAA